MKGIILSTINTDCHNARSSISVISTALESSKNALLNCNINTPHVSGVLIDKILNVINDALEEVDSLELLINKLSENIVEK